MKFIIKIIFTRFILQALLITVIIFITLLPSTHAQTPTCTTSTPRAEGLVSAPQQSLTSKFGTSSGACIIDPKASFVPFKIPTFDDLKSLYFDQSKATKSTALTSISSTTTFSGDTVYYVNGDLTVSGTPTGSGTPVIFINGNLNITSNYTYGTPLTGTVFIVKGNVNIFSSISRIDTEIISEGTICTAYDGISCPAINTTSSQLVINGSLISLNSATPIKFRRTLSDNTLPSEKINHQVKYLVILRNIFSETLQKWTEIAGSVSLPSPPPPPTSTPPPLMYVDNDLDGYGAGASVNPCPAGKTCVTNNTDCYDVSFSVNPGQTNYFTEQRGDGSFDYNCDGIASRKYPSVANCFATPLFSDNICATPVTGYGNALNTNNIGCGQFIASNTCGSSQQNLTPWYIDDGFGGCFANGSYVSQVEGTPTSPSYTVNQCH